VTKPKALGDLVSKFRHTLLVLDVKIRN